MALFTRVNRGTAASASTVVGNHSYPPLGRSAMIVLVAIAGAALPTRGQNANQVTAVSPNSATQGTSGLIVTFTLDTDSPPVPPSDIPAEGATLGDISGTSVTHTAQYTVTAVFDIPADELPGVKDATVTFSTPNGTLTFTMIDGFTVTAAAQSPPGISRQPTARTAPPGATVTFSIAAYGADPLSYRWQRDEVDIDGATESFWTITDVARDDAGSYRCVVTNDYGTLASDSAALTVTELPDSGYAVVDTGQATCYDSAAGISCPADGTAFHGQDAEYTGNAPTYALSGDGLCVCDNATGLTWQRSPETNGDATIDAADKLTWTEAQVWPDVLNAGGFGGYDDWRLPTIKELYSLIDFRGTDPSACNTEADCPGLVPFIDTDYFEFAYGDVDAGERVLDSQYASCTLYVSAVDEALLFGVNFADGRIKGYGLTVGGSEKTFLVMCVRGNAEYGVNNFLNNGDGTVTDLSTGLMWTREDSGYGMVWEDALAYAESLDIGGHDDWRLPNAKELQSILDYTRSPDTTGSAAIDPVFNATTIVNEEGADDYPYYWTGTTHVSYPDGGTAAAYVAFGRGLGYMNGEWRDVHGAGCQRSDPKAGDPIDYPTGHGPQGDAIRIYNFVRCVRTTYCPADLDEDGRVDSDDVTAFEACATGPAIALTEPACKRADFDADGDVDQADFGVLQVRLGASGAGCE